VEADAGQHHDWGAGAEWVLEKVPVLGDGFDLVHMMAWEPSHLQAVEKVEAVLQQRILLAIALFP
jgi:hypothetical protein